MEKDIKLFLQETNRLGLRNLHNVFGFDYNKPFLLYRGEGTFTENKIAHILRDHGFEPLKTTTAILSPERWGGGRLGLAYTFGGSVGVDRFCGRYCGYGSNISEFSMKKCFEWSRKNCDHFYIIAQLHTDLVANPDAKEREIDKGDRVVIDDIRTFVYTHGTTEYISKVRVKQNRRKKDIHTYYRADLRRDQVNEMIDKSGYILVYKREKLKAEAQALRTRREKERYNNADFSAQIKTAKENAEAIRCAAVDLLKTATTSKEVNFVGRFIYGFEGLGRLYDIIDEMEKKDAAKTYASINNFLYDLKRAEKLTETLQEELKGV